MKRYLFALLFLVSFSAAVEAGQVGGLATNVGRGGLALSAGLTYIDKDVERSGHKEGMTSRQLAVKGSYGLLPNLDLNVKLGFADLEAGSFEGRLDALYGIGFKLKMFQDPSDKVNVLLDGDISRFSNEDDGVDADVLDYHVAFTVSNRAGNITPYGGIKFSETEVEFDGRTFTADNNVGVFGGADYFVNPNVFFTGEINIFDQDAIYVGVGYKF